MHYDLRTEPAGFSWFNRPPKYRFGAGLEILTAGRTDFWQRTHYGFRKDDGHAYLRRISEDFTITTHATWEPQGQYDQCGVFARVDATNWIKASVEYEGLLPSRLGSVVTNLGYSDWATQDLSSSTRSMWYRLSRRESDVLIEWSNDGKTWTQMRVAHLHAAAEEIEIGIYACSPVGDGFSCVFSHIDIGDFRGRPTSD